MKYTVVYTPLAEYSTGGYLAACCRSASSHGRLRSNRVACLRSDADQHWRSHADGWRVDRRHRRSAVTFEVSADDRLVTIVSVRYRP